MNKSKENKSKEKRLGSLPENAVFALDIGTRSIIGVVGLRVNDKIRVVAIERAEHSKRAMIDGQIEDIDRVSSVAAQVKAKLEEQLNMRLDRVCLAAAGRALKTQRAVYEMELPEVRFIDEELISRLEAGAIGKAEEAFEDGLEEDEGGKRRFYLVGYTVCQYYLDNYLMSNLKEHRGKKLKADLIATFLPSEVVESLYSTMHKIGLEIASLTLEPIAAINAAIPENLRLLNLVLVDIGAGTSDIAACRDGSVIGYTMATVAGDEVTETIMKEYLVDFQTAERMKSELEEKEEIAYTDVLGMEQAVSASKLYQCIQDTFSRLCREISDKILEVNGGQPSAVFLAGGGSKLAGLKKGITECLGMDEKRVGIAGNNFQISAFSESYDLNNPEYATPLGIAISAGLGLINDSCQVMLNDRQAKLFRSGVFTARDLLMMNGYSFQDLIGRSGQNLIITVNAKRMIFYGSKAEPAQLRINGAEGRLSDIVHAGDNITFVPAKPGEPARAAVKDIRGLPDDVSVKVNLKRATLDTPLKNGDMVTVSVSSTADESTDDNLEAESADAISNGQHDSASSEAVTEVASTMAAVTPGDAFASSHSAGDAKETPNPKREEGRAQPTADTPGKAGNHSPAQVMSSLASHSSVTALAETAASAESPAVKVKTDTHRETITLHLNGSPLTLPPKSDMSPYYLMDMLEYSGIDFKNIKGKVVLEVNDVPGYFQQPLKQNDHITIYEEK